MSGEEGEGEEVDGHTFFVYDGETADEEFLVGSLAILGEGEEVSETIEVVFVCELEGRTLVAVPQPAWHRRAISRKLPPGALAKACAVEMAATARNERSTAQPGVRMKVWLGFLAEELANRVSFDDADEGGAVGPSVAFQDTAGESGYLPFAQALVEVAKDKFQFHTAESGEPLARHQGAREDRLGRLEAAVSSMAETIKALTKSQQVHHVGTRSSPATTSSPARPQQKPRTNSLPGLDPGVVQAALAAGVDHKALEDMASLGTRQGGCRRHLSLSGETLWEKAMARPRTPSQGAPMLDCCRW